MKNANTVSGRAAIRTSRSTTSRCSTATTLPPFFEFRCKLQTFEALVPESLEKRTQVGEAFRAGPVETSCSVPALCDEPSFLEDGQVLGDGGPRHVELRRNLAGAELSAGDELEDSAATRFREGANGFFHSQAYCKHNLT
jgi:hypothetical protein